VSTINKYRNEMFGSFLKHHGLSKDQCKKFVYAILYEGDVEFVLKSYGLTLPDLEKGECLKAYRTFEKAQTEFKELAEALKKLMGSKWETVPCSEKTRKAKREDVGRISMVMQHIERQLIEHVAYWLKNCQKGK